MDISVIKLPGCFKLIGYLIKYIKNRVDHGEKKADYILCKNEKMNQNKNIMILQVTYKSKHFILILMCQLKKKTNHFKIFVKAMN